MMGADVPIPEPEQETPASPVRLFVQTLFADHPPGILNEVNRVGMLALDEGDLRLARAAADFVLTRAPVHSGDLLRGQVLQALIEEKGGNSRRYDQLMENVIKERF
jgi:hypothetical protein